MDSTSSSDAPLGTMGNHDAYVEALRGHAHELLAMGYGRLEPARYKDSEEPDITGELAKAVEEAIEDPEAPQWVDHYALGDDPPLNVEGRLGKWRPRVDVEFQRVQHGPRPRLRFEAKRLDPKHPVSIYLGRDGMGCFLSGLYPAPSGEAGMLGYVQSEDEQTWAAKIEERLSAHPTEYELASDGGWRKQVVSPRLAHTYRTHHLPEKTRVALTVHHVLLRFC